MEIKIIMTNKFKKKWLNRIVLIAYVVAFIATIAHEVITYMM